ncbi:MAG: CAP domain-containing protein [Chitinophagaceae bacterium]
MKFRCTHLRSFMLKGCFLLAVLAFHYCGQAQRLTKREEKFYQQEILKYINQYRSNKGKGALELDDNLNAIAYRHSRDMSSGNVAFGHDGFDDRMAKVRKYNPRLAGFAENVAAGMQSPREVSADWYGSSGHRRNLLGDYILTGIGVERGSDGELYFTQVFVK